MFFELQDVKRRHNPSWWTNNVTAWHTTVDSTLSWNLQRGAIIGTVAGVMQQYLTHFIFHANAMFKQYQPPIGLPQWLIFIRETLKLESFRSGLKNRLQLGATVGVVAIAPQIAMMRQFNSGWSNNFGGFEYNYYRKFPSIIGAAILSSPFGIAVDMAARAYYADQSFPRQLQKGYKSFWDAFKRIPFEQGPYYLFKNTFPLFIKHCMGPFTYLYTYDWFIDKLSFMWRVAGMPVLPTVIFCAAFSTYVAAVFTYPFAVVSREIVDIWPKKKSIDYFGGNYRKASIYIWFSQNILLYYAGFVKRYLWHVSPQWFITLLLAQKFGIFKYWKIDVFNGAADNSNEDSFV